MKTRKPIAARGIPVRTQWQAGNLASDKCYAERNNRTWECTWANWNQIIAWCRGTNNEGMLKRCLNKSGETNWWNNFEDCKGKDAAQCIALSPLDTE